MLFRLCLALLIIISTTISHSLFALNTLLIEVSKCDEVKMANRYGTNLRWNWDKKWWKNSHGYLSGYWEASVAYWDNKSSEKNHSSVIDVAVTPVLRYHYIEEILFTPFVELGIGAHVHSRSTIGYKNLDLPFSFGSHLGAGVLLGKDKKYECSYRFQHLSNAGIGKNNPGINFHLLYIGYHF